MSENGTFEHEEIPPGVPGRIRLCEWCGHAWNNLVMQGAMTYCPECNKPSLIKECSRCKAPIAFPPQLYCFACGERLTIMPMIAEGGILRQATVAEPDEARRKELEAKGGNWYDVLRGKAEGPVAPVKAAVPVGWNKEDFAKLVALAAGQAGEQPDGADAVAIKQCKHCHIKLTYTGAFAVYTCPVCKEQAEDFADQPPPG